jgi:hypothetical protein
MTSESDIQGNGFGYEHSWKRGFTPQVGSAPNEQRYTYYQCRICGWLFKHQYNIIPDIFLAMKRTGVPEFCSLATGANKKTESESDSVSASSSSETD